MSLEYRVTELPAVWPGKPTTYRKKAPFKTQWARTLHILERELKHLGARKIEFALAIRFGDLRQDGMLPADARPGPAVIVSFIDRDGQRQAYPCDTFAWWQDNLYAIAVVLEDLRRAERYGVQSALLRAGFKALPSAGGSTPTLSTSQAASLIARLADEEGNESVVLADKSWALALIRRAKARTHPDAGGRNEDWTLLQEAERIVTAHHGANSHDGLPLPDAGTAAPTSHDDGRVRASAPLGLRRGIRAGVDAPERRVSHSEGAGIGRTLLGHRRGSRLRSAFPLPRRRRRRPMSDMTQNELEIRTEIASLARIAYWLLNRGSTKQSAAFDIERCVRHLNRIAAGAGAWSDDELRKLLGYTVAVTPAKSGGAR